jgi:hypothetical protein
MRKTLQQKPMEKFNRPLTKKELDRIYYSTRHNANKGTGGGKLYSAYVKNGYTKEEAKKLCNAKDFTITKDDLQNLWIEQQGRCADSNFEIDTKYLFPPYNQHSLAPSVDRINGDIGYVKGNIRFVLRGFNKFRGNMSIDEWNEFKSKIKFCS